MDNQKAKVTELPPQYFSRDDLIIEQLRDIGKRLDRIETRQYFLEEKLETTRKEIKDVRDELNERINKVEIVLHGRIDKVETSFKDEINDLRNDMKSFIRHSQILTASVVGLVFAFFFSLK